VSPVSREEFAALPGGRPGPGRRLRPGEGTSSRGSPRTAAGALRRGRRRCDGRLPAPTRSSPRQPGRLVRVRHEIHGTIETLDGGGLAPTPFDDCSVSSASAARRGRRSSSSFRKVTGSHQGSARRHVRGASSRGWGRTGAPEPPAREVDLDLDADSVDPRAPPDDEGRRGPLLRSRRVSDGLFRTPPNGGSPKP